MTKDCKVCLAQHDEEIHAATIRVHQWFRARIVKHLDDTTVDPMLSEGEELEAPQLSAA